MNRMNVRLAAITMPRANLELDRYVFLIRQMPSEIRLVDAAKKAVSKFFRRRYAKNKPFIHRVLSSSATVNAVEFIQLHNVVVHFERNKEMNSE